MEERGNARGFAVEDNAWRGCINGSVREYIGHLVWVETVKYLRNIYETGWQRFSAFRNSRSNVFNVSRFKDILIDAEIALQGIKVSYDIVIDVEI